MAETSKRMGVSAEDRLSSLPRNVIDHMMEFLPIQDAARTSTLSKNWRYIWANHPWLVLDQNFWLSLKQKKFYVNKDSGFIRIVSKLLLQHTAPIQKFVLDISDLNPSLFSEIDAWMFFLNSKGLREFTIQNTQPEPYQIPSYLYNYHELTNLGLSNCILKEPKTFQAFHKLNELFLERITLQSVVTISTPLLERLYLIECRGACILNIRAPNLQSLALVDNDGLPVSNYIPCKNITSAYLSLSSGAEQQISEIERVTLTELLNVWPKLLECIMDGFSIKHLAAGYNPDQWLSTKLNCLKTLLLVRMSYDLDQIAWTLYFLRNSPMLKEFEIWTSPNVSDDMNVQNYLKDACCWMPSVEQLRKVKLKYFKGSEAELLLVKLLLGCSPTLERIIIKDDLSLDIIESLRIEKELMRSSRASPNAVFDFD